ncbi:hypothetical protein DND132_1300 [Pseudodesulfovibrio mercurii]|uniref:Uncharacterized protein n=1 Tax=Pseudodesulfovibrio mercurii TaxID=641491 RepID=F0JD17_9BACT|nr:hypothetical protein [Pseudodesulfovibrio mercurii]EGB14509.1 hypothetical protein DND132_1300 [Pseudodesulfovibrio mercurii]
MFKKLIYVCLWLCILSGTASTASSPAVSQAPASFATAPVRATLTP